MAVDGHGPVWQAVLGVLPLSERQQTLPPVHVVESMHVMPAPASALPLLLPLPLLLLLLLPLLLPLLELVLPSSPPSAGGVAGELELLQATAIATAAVPDTAHKIIEFVILETTSSVMAQANCPRPGRCGCLMFVSIVLAQRKGHSAGIRRDRGA
jgi:hypothetical protein